MTFAVIMLGGLLIEASIGWPAALFARIGHPVTWMGRAISVCETRWNNGTRRQRIFGGTVTVILMVGMAATLAWVVQMMLPAGSIGWAIGAVLAWPFLAARSLHDHVKAVADPLQNGDLPGARHAVSMIAGRDPEQLDQAGIARAAMESLAENCSDGVIAPVFWGLIAGLPGIVAYKTINTMDSMIGHRNDRYEAFGKPAARLDDLINWLPARLNGVLFALAAASQNALRVMWHDAASHRSPNAGWPETAMAGALNVRLSGPRVYGDRVADEPWLNSGAPDPVAADLVRGLRLYRRAIVVFALALFGLALL